MHRRDQDCAPATIDDLSVGDWAGRWSVYSRRGLSTGVARATVEVIRRQAVRTMRYLAAEASIQGSA
jgi:hypothetical protein